MDDGGQYFLQTRSWINEGISKTDAVLKGEVSTGYWTREAWGAKLYHDQVEIYSLHDESYTEFITSHEFRRALAFWYEFIQSPPQENSFRDVEI